MSYINVNNLTFAYEGSYDNIFENVSLRIDTGWRLGLTGRNGRGKTTFMKLLLGKYEYSGSIVSDMDFAYFPYEVADESETAIEIMQEICPTADDWELIKEASLLDMECETLYRPFETLSSGEQTKLLLAAMFVGENRYLLIDEPTNHLDAEGRRKLSEYLKKKNGFILVSHDRTLLDCCVDHVMSINRSDIEIVQGNFSAWWENKNRRDRYELDENKRLKKDIQRLSDSAKRTAQWSAQVENTKNGVRNSGLRADRGYVSHKSAKMMKRSKSQENRMLAAAEEKSHLLKNIETSDSLKIMPLDYIRNTLIYAKDLSLFYGDYTACGGISFEINRGDRIAVSGKNGCGKSTLLKLICGENIRYDGIFNVGSQLKISYVPQDTSHLQGSMSDYAGKYKIDESLFKAILRKLGFERIQFENQMQDLSGGQKKKILIARSLCERAHLYVWDEPLNFIDVISRIQIEELIAQCKPTMIFVEHDEAFKNKIATQKLLI